MQIAVCSRSCRTLLHVSCLYVITSLPQSYVNPWLDKSSLGAPLNRGQSMKALFLCQQDVDDLLEPSCLNEFTEIIF